jgi:EAL domain-containing protein (putative c-di-GMP-specific phosphodiesterase class I)
MEQSPAIDAFKLLRSADADAAATAGTRTEANARVRFGVAKALAQGRIGFHYQPVVRADDPRRPAFFEMLARMTMPDGSLVSAGEFLPLVEEGALGRAIDRLALAHALKTLVADPGLRLSVNMSPRSMGDADWLAILAAADRGGSGVCGRLILEITEDAAMEDCAQTIDFMNHVRSTGCAFALDDFGAGATGFRHFRDFRFDMVKIDGAFVQGVHKARDSQVLVECLRAVAQHFEMFTVAERVEDPADADWLRGIGVDCFQGYLYGRPAPVAELPPAILPNDDRAAG